MAANRRPVRTGPKIVGQTQMCRECGASSTGLCGYGSGYAGSGYAGQRV